MWGKKNNNLGWYFQILCLQQHESLFRCGRDAKMHIYIQQTLLSKATDNKHICQKEKQQHITVGTVRMFIEQVPSANGLSELSPLPVYNKDS